MGIKCIVSFLLEGVAMMRYFYAIFFTCWLLQPRAIHGDPGLVTGVGSSIIDMLVQVDDDFFVSHVPGQRGGSYRFDREGFNRILEDVKSISKIAPGGSAANTIKALSKLGIPCLFSSHVGDDSSGARYCQEMSVMGIDGVEKDPNFSTIQILCLITPDGERTFLYCHGTYDWNRVAAEHFRKAKWAHFESFLLWEAPTYCELSLRLAREMGVCVSLDLSNFSVVQQHRDKIFEWIGRYVDVLFGNEDEVRILTGLSPEEGCMKLQEMCSIVVMTKGANGCLIGHRGELIEVPAFSAKVVDTTGAGDYFSAGFIYGCLHHYSLVDCARIGHRMGSAITELVGTDLPEEKWDEIRAFMKSEKL